MTPIQWIIPYYRNRPMLELHLLNWSRYDADVLAALTIILVDDGSPTADRPDELLRAAPELVRSRIRLLRVLKDISWNQHGARNLGAHVAHDGWLLITDMDRVLLKCDMRNLMACRLKSSRFYKPIGIRMSPTLPVVDGEKGPYNQLVVHRQTYWKAGGYDEDYCGCYAGDKQFLDAIAELVKFQRLMSVRMYRYNRHVVPGANTEGLDRNPEEGRRRYREKLARGDTHPKNPLRFNWQEVAL